MKELNYVGNLILESYEEHIEDESYLKEIELELSKCKNKLESLYFLFNADQRIRNSFANKIEVNDEELKTLLKVLQKI